MNYLGLFFSSLDTGEDLKCNKVLDAYSQIVCGRVRETQSRFVDAMCVIKANVNHALIQCFWRLTILHIFDISPTHPIIIGIVIKQPKLIKGLIKS